MKAPTNYQEAVVIAEKLGLDLQEILFAYGIEDPEDAELRAKIEAATGIEDIWEVFDDSPSRSPIKTESLKRIVERTK